MAKPLGESIVAGPPVRDQNRGDRTPNRPDEPQYNRNRVHEPNRIAGRPGFVGWLLDLVEFADGAQ